MDRLPVWLSADIASKPGILAGLRERQILAVSDRLDILSLTDPFMIVDLANSRPAVIPKLPVDTIDLFIRMKGFMRELHGPTVQLLVYSTEFARILEQVCPGGFNKQVADSYPPHLRCQNRALPS